jgi:hypothetical protein
MADIVNTVPSAFLASVIGHIPTYLRGRIRSSFTALGSKSRRSCDVVIGSLVSGSGSGYYGPA